MDEDEIEAKIKRTKEIMAANLLQREGKPKTSVVS
jgi:hypothetical protein